ncbi:MULTISPECIES: sensor histidine kinase [Niastella]|uniref:histidine kinase n=1 Tax=Niastella soli TaxID=2821487 RepID=A0ABS3YXK4_9BACT|nr:HAMP domain-containing sensor histidine kinase [Niastella soli]MBO9202584.1 HAMP domain-containing histidine kinase [Niastella soli]
MRKRLKFTFFIAFLTVAMVILFQVTWVYNSYKASERNFITSARFALRRAITSYQLQQNELPTSLQYKEPTLTFFQSTIPNRDSIALDTPKVIKRFNAKFTTVKVDEENKDALLEILGRLLSQQMHTPLNPDSLNLFFKKELLKENIRVPFRLIVSTNAKVATDHAISVPVNFYRSPVIVQAIPKNQSLALWRQNIIPASVSLLLILLSAGSLLIMGKMIIRQMRLNKFKNDFINNITHELRTPITILKSSVDALETFGAAADPEKLTRYLKTNGVILNKMDQDIDRILEISKYEQGVIRAQLKRVDVAQLAREVSNRFNLTLPDAVLINYNLSQPMVNTDPFILDSVFSNLIDNAIKYSNHPVHIEINFQPIINGWQLQVADKGKGIASFHLPFIFDKFYRVQTSDVHEVKGYGLGLSFVKELALILDGEISVASKPDQGTTFTIRFYDK